MKHRAIAAVAVLALATLSSTGVRAHPLDPILLEIIEHDDVVQLALRYPVSPRPGISPLGVKLPPHCRSLPIVDEARRGGTVSRRWRADCGGQSLAGATVELEGLSSRDNDALIRIVLLDGPSVQAVVRPDDPRLTISSRATKTLVLRDYVALGFQHILSGLDHLLFIFGLLLLVRGIRPLVATITAFTLGHSVTLALAVLGALTFPQRVIEVLIAASLVVLALEVVRDGRGRLSFMGQRPWLMASAFGLLHGLGFAGALQAAGLPDGEIPLALVSFNLGIEAGQLVFVVAVIALHSAFARVPGTQKLTSPRWIPGYAMGSLAFFWMIERTTRLLGP